MQKGCVGKAHGKRTYRSRRKKKTPRDAKKGEVRATLRKNVANSKDGKTVKREDVW